MSLVHKFVIRDGELVDCGVMNRPGPLHHAPKLEVLYNDSYNENGNGVPGSVREKHYAEHIRALRKTGGETKEGKLRHVASIPAEAYWKEQTETGGGRPDQGRLQDKNEVVKFAKEHDFNVAPKDSF